MKSPPKNGAIFLSYDRENDQSEDRENDQSEMSSVYAG